MQRRRVLIGLLAMLAATGAVIALHERFSISTRSPLAEGERAYQEGNWSLAIEKARASIKAKPGEAAALLLLARALSHNGDDLRAESIYRQLGTSKMLVEDLFLMGRGLIKRGQTGPGMAALGAALDADPDHPETLDMLLTLTLASDQPRLLEAARRAERLARSTDWEVRGLLALGRVQHDLLQPAASAAALKRALELDPQLAQAEGDPREFRRLLARSLLENGQSGEARTQLSKTLEAGPDPEASWLLSRACLMEGEIEQARSALAAAQPFRDDPLRLEPAPFVGATRCAACHSKEYRSQQASHHAQTIKGGPELSKLPWPSAPVVDRDNPQVSHVVATAEEHVEVSTRVEDRTFSALVEYAIGSNHQGRSFVGHDREGQARELRLSEYPSAPLWSRTSEHPPEPREIEGYLGRPISDESVRRCVHCHSTNFQAVQQPEGRLEAADHGIGCERCHGPGGHHVRAVELKFSDLAIARPRLASAEQVVALCAQCHQAPESASPRSPGFIRFQAPTMVQSRCYTESGSLSCVTCHNPHRDAGRNPAEYEAICLQCHPAQAAKSKEPAAGLGRPKTWTSCPTRSTQGCLECHMPRIREAVPRTTFTDHFIRVRKANDGP
jgi:tetratricopeptide (TPR) repeat protein